MLVSCRNQTVEVALQVANRAIREAGFWVPYLTIEALDAWTPLAITMEHLKGTPSSTRTASTGTSRRRRSAASSSKSMII